MCYVRNRTWGKSMILISSRSNVVQTIWCITWIIIYISPELGNQIGCFFLHPYPISYLYRKYIPEVHKTHIICAFMWCVLIEYGIYDAAHHKEDFSVWAFLDIWIYGYIIWMKTFRKQSECWKHLENNKENNQNAWSFFSCNIWMPWPILRLKK